MNIPRAVYESMLKHARQEAPLEACGLVTGRKGEVSRFEPVTNAAASERRYRMEAGELLDHMLALEAEERELLAIFHSHPATEAYPSPTDRRQAHYDCVYLILSLAGKPVLRGFKILGEPEEGASRRVQEVPVSVSERP